MFISYLSRRHKEVLLVLQFAQVGLGPNLAPRLMGRRCFGSATIFGEVILLGGFLFSWWKSDDDITS